MSVKPTLKIDDFNTICGTIGGLIILYGLVSFVVKEHLYLSEATIATAIGIAFGPHGAGWIEPATFGNIDDITRNFARLVLGFRLFLTGVQLPQKYLRVEWKSLSMLLGPVMTVKWIVCTGFILAFIPGLRFVDALVIGACVTPTDPVLSTTIVKGGFAEKNIAVRLRDIISAESGANDGFGYPFLFLGLNILRYPAGRAVETWVIDTVCYQVLLSVAYGTVVGYLAQKVLHIAVHYKLIDRESFHISAFAVAVFILGTCGSIGTDDLLACFVAGNVFTWDDWYRIKTKDDSLQDTFDLLFNLGFFIFYGTLIPWNQLNTSEIPVWRFIVLGVVIMAFRRLPLVLVLYKFIPAIQNLREACFAGFFGPIGVGAIFYVQIAIEFLITPGAGQLESVAEDNRLVQLLPVIVYFLVLCSIIVHGFTILFAKSGLGFKRTFSTSTKSSDRAPTLRIPLTMRDQSRNGTADRHSTMEDEVHDEISLSSMT